MRTVTNLSPPKRTPIHLYSGKYPILTSNNIGTILLWTGHNACVCIHPGDTRQSGWSLGEVYSPCDEEREVWGEASTVVVADDLTITFKAGDDQ